MKKEVIKSGVTRRNDVKEYPTKKARLLNLTFLT